MTPVQTSEMAVAAQFPKIKNHREVPVVETVYSTLEHTATIALFPAVATGAPLPFIQYSTMKPLGFADPLKDTKSCLDQY